MCESEIIIDYKKEHNSILPAKEAFYLAQLWKNNSFNDLLDLGCGSGRNSIHFAKNGFQVTATDFCDYAINNVMEWANRENINLNTKLCNMVQLPFDDNTFDCVFAYDVIYYSDFKGFIKSVNEIKRVLKPGGEAFITLISKNIQNYINTYYYSTLDENTVIINGNTGRNLIEKNTPLVLVDIDDIKRYFGEFEFISDLLEEREYRINQDEDLITYFKFIIKKAEL